MFYTKFPFGKGTTWSYLVKLIFYPIFRLVKIRHFELCPKKVRSTSRISWYSFWYKSTHVKVQMGQVSHFIYNLNDWLSIISSTMKYVLKYTESAIGNSSGNSVYNRKLLKMYVKSLKNTCYDVNFWKSCEKEAWNFTKIWGLYRSFIKTKSTIIIIHKIIRVKL